MFELIIALTLSAPVDIHSMIIDGEKMTTSALSIGMTVKVGPFKDEIKCKLHLDAMPQTIGQGTMTLVVKSKQCQPVLVPTT